MDTEFWALDPATTHLNHGSFGATPRPVLDAQAAWRMQMESNPVRFMEDVLPGALLAAAHRLAGHVGADPAGLVFVPNATAGVNAALRSLEPDLERGDEILITDHAYNACANAVRVTAERTGAKVAVATVPFPLDGPDSVISAITAAARSRTAVVVIDQVTSPTGLVFPVAELVAEFEPDVTVIVDGAHAPGMLPLAVDALGASYYAGNCHKWLCAPKGAGFLVARPDRRERTIPPVISHGWNRPWPGLDRYRSMFGWTGTGDPTAFLSVPVALDAMAGRFGGWEAIMAANHALAVEGRLGRQPAAPSLRSALQPTGRLRAARRLADGLPWRLRRSVGNGVRLPWSARNSPSRGRASAAGGKWLVATLVRSWSIGRLPTSQDMPIR